MSGAWCEGRSWVRNEGKSGRCTQFRGGRCCRCRNRDRIRGKHGCKPPPYEGVISGESVVMNAECRTYNDRRENPLDKKSYHAYAGVGR